MEWSVWAVHLSESQTGLEKTSVADSFLVNRIYLTIEGNFIKTDDFGGGNCISVYVDDFLICYLCRKMPSIK
jgi:hypothetical protein